MHHPFRIHHLLTILESFDEQTAPIDLFVSRYFRAHKAIGSKDKKFITEILYGMIRWKGLLDYLCDNPYTWEKRLNTFLSIDTEKCFNDAEIPLHIRCSFPKDLFDLIIDSHGEELGCAICLACNEPAPTAIRVNSFKTTREALIKSWDNKFSISPCEVSNNGIIFHKKINFFELPEFKNGFFEIQDEASQMVGKLVTAEPGQQVMDYCAGSGGKTLAFAPFMKNHGQIFLHDIRENILQQARKRLKRAGIQNAQTVHAEDPKLKKLKKKMDWVLVDAPCSGTGTLRRNPDMKWKFSREMLERLVGQQRQIFEKGLSFLKPDGKIIYATCSILKEENELQLEHFLSTYSLELTAPPFQSIPKKGEMDGFFGAILKKK